MVNETDYADIDLRATLALEKLANAVARYVAVQEQLIGPTVKTLELTAKAQELALAEFDDQVGGGPFGNMGIGGADRTAQDAPSISTHSWLKEMVESVGELGGSAKQAMNEQATEQDDINFRFTFND